VRIASDDFRSHIAGFAADIAGVLFTIGGYIVIITNQYIAGLYIDEKIPVVKILIT
jgi:hypothetical protein